MLRYSLTELPVSCYFKLNEFDFTTDLKTETSTDRMDVKASEVQNSNTGKDRLLIYL